jgi:hypothetical protein
VYCADPAQSRLSSSLPSSNQPPKLIEADGLIGRGDLARFPDGQTELPVTLCESNSFDSSIVAIAAHSIIKILFDRSNSGLSIGFVRSFLVEFIRSVSRDGDFFILVCHLLAMTH